MSRSNQHEFCFCHIKSTIVGSEPLINAIHADLYLVRFGHCQQRLYVSSANIIGFEFNKQLGRSFMYNKNKREPKIVPCGTPHSRVHGSDNEPFAEHL